MTTHPTNLGVRPLGGKTSSGEFQWLTDVERQFMAEQDECLPINSNDKAKKLRTAHVKMTPGLAPIFRSLHLDF